MKFIDEKGRLFGKINLIDLLVILMVLAAAAALVWKLGGKSAAKAVVKNDFPVTYTVLVSEVPADAARFAETQIGTSLVNNGKILDAKIISAELSNPDVEAGRTDLRLTIDGSTVFSGNVYKVGSQEIRVGYEYIVKTSELELTGIITAMEVSK